MSELKNQTNSYLSFTLGKETFAANVSKVLNILEMLDITEIPQSPKYMKGVINLRGIVLPVIDLNLKFSMPATIIGANTCILVLDVLVNDEPVKVGALVDSVQEVIDLTATEIQDPPSIGNKYNTDFIQGLVNKEDKFIMILDMDMIFSVNEIENILTKIPASN